MENISLKLLFACLACHTNNFSLLFCCIQSEIIQFAYLWAATERTSGTFMHIRQTNILRIVNERKASYYFILFCIELKLMQSENFVFTSVLRQISPRTVQMKIDKPEFDDSSADSKLFTSFFRLDAPSSSPLQRGFREGGRRVDSKTLRNSISLQAQSFLSSARHLSTSKRE